MGGVRKFVIACVVGLIATSGSRAGEVIPEIIVNGKIYQNVRWGPVNNGKVVILHGRGSAIVPIEQLPPEYQRRLGFTPAEPVVTEAPRQQWSPPAPAPAPVMPPADDGDSAFERARRQQQQ